MLGPVAASMAKGGWKASSRVTLPRRGIIGAIMVGLGAILGCSIWAEFAEVIEIILKYGAGVANADW